LARKQNISIGLWLQQGHWQWYPGAGWPLPLLGNKNILGRPHWT